MKKFHYVVFWRYNEKVLASANIAVYIFNFIFQMESAGAVDIFNRSLENYGLMYKEYLGDGDTSSFNDVIKSNPYKDHNLTPIKLECIGHVQKRVGTRLRNLVKSHKGTKTPLAGKGKLTNKCIDSMQNYYGLAIRNNIGNLYAMKKAISAILFHFTDIRDSYKTHSVLSP